MSPLGDQKSRISRIFFQIDSCGATNDLAVFVVTSAMTGANELVNVGAVLDIAPLVRANRRACDHTFIGVRHDHAVVTQIENFEAADFAQFGVVVQAQHELVVAYFGRFALVVFVFFLRSPSNAADDKRATERAYPA